MFYRHLFSVLLIPLLALTQSASAKSKKKKRPSIESKKNFQVNYGSSSWNEDSTRIDSANLLIRDKSTGKMAQIQLEESAPDSASFTGSFSLNWKKAKKVTPQIYIPPQNLRKQKNWVEQVNKMIRTGKLRRQPFLIKKDENVMEVYDNKEQAKAALKAYRQELSLKRAKLLKKNPTDKDTIAAESVFEAAKLLEAAALKKKLALEAAKRASERIRLAQIEQQKEKERLKRQKAFSKAQQEKRKKKAAILAKKALKMFHSGKIQESVNLFNQSIDLDPENRTYYYQYGVALFKLKKYNDSIVILKKASSVNDAERDYFLGLNHYHLKEYDESFANFEKTKKAKHERLSPTASFYQGLIKFNELKYEEAKPFFEYVLDTSKDPRLDQQAEQYIEQIAGILFFAEQAKIKFFLNITAGLTYDSNILFTSDSTVSAGTATNLAGARTLAIIGGKYRPVYSKSHEFTTDLDLIYYYSFNSAHASVDPFIATVSLPYVYKRTLFGKGFQTKVNPGYELLYMDTLSQGTRKQILKSMKLDWDNTLIMSGTWFSAYNVSLRIDDSLLATSVGDEDSDATKIVVDTTQTFFLDKAKSKLLIGDFGITSHGAKGRNQKHFRFDLGVSHVRPSWWEMSWTSALKYYNANYSSSTTGRKDSNFVLSSGLSKPIGKKYTVGVTADYTKNSSNVAANTYKKWSVLSTFSAAYSF